MIGDSAPLAAICNIYLSFEKTRDFLVTPEKEGLEEDSKLFLDISLLQTEFM